MNLLKAPGSRSQAQGRAGARVTPLTFGVVAGLLAVGLEAFFAVRPPSAYGVCIACHGRDLVNWVVNNRARTSLPVAEVSLAFPLLTVVGVVIGAALASVSRGEFRWHRPDRILPSFLWGFLAMNFALLAAGCSLRLVLRAAHGEALGVLALGAMVAGIGLATSLMKWRALR